jgi:heptosyltransferase-2/heptosyltransferase-3
VERNRQLAAFQHRLSWREQLRRELLWLALYVPTFPARAQKGTFLLIRPDHLGDMLLTMPALQALRRAQPKATLFGLAGAWSAPVMAAYPDIDTVLTVPFPGFTRRNKKGWLIMPYVHAWRWAHQIRSLRIETAIVLRPDHWWGGLLAKLAGIPQRVGFDHPDLRPFLTHPVPIREPREHVVLQSARLVERWTGSLTPANLRLTFPIDAADREYIDGLLRTAEVGLDRPLVVIHPGAGTPIKRWLPEHWAVVADRLAEHLNAVVIFTGSDQESADINRVRERLRSTSVSLAGDTNVAQLAALYARAVLVLGPDSGPLHLAVAAGAPTLHLFGPADPALFGPWGDPQRQVAINTGIRCQPCNILAWMGDNPDFHPCVRDITPRQVLDAAFQILRLQP